MKYINADELNAKIYEEYDPSDDDYVHIGIGIVQDLLNRMPSADVVEVETLKKNIEANLDEARKLRDEYSSELIRAFQQGRMFGHECDLEMIKRGKTE